MSSSELRVKTANLQRLQGVAKSKDNENHVHAWLKLPKVCS
jgi:hypothetical protein